MNSDHRFMMMLSFVLFMLWMLLAFGAHHCGRALDAQMRINEALESKVEQLEQRLQAMDDKYHARTMELQQAAPKHPSNNWERR